MDHIDITFDITRPTPGGRVDRFLQTLTDFWFSVDRFRRPIFFRSADWLTDFCVFGTPLERNRLKKSVRKIGQPIRSIKKPLRKPPPKPQNRSTRKRLTTSVNQTIKSIPSAAPDGVQDGCSSRLDALGIQNDCPQPFQLASEALSRIGNPQRLSRKLVRDWPSDPTSKQNLARNRPLSRLRKRIGARKNGNVPCQQPGDWALDIAILRSTMPVAPASSSAQS